MTPSSSSLPTPSQFLTSLLDIIAAIPAPDAEFQQQQQQAAQSHTKTTPTVGGAPRRAVPSNPLKLLSTSHRNCFLTLHVLFPSLLLPALDLLDRGLVARLSLPRHEEEEDGEGRRERRRRRRSGGGVQGDGEESKMMATDDENLPTVAAGQGIPTPTPTTNNRTKRPGQVYHVRSAVQKNSHPFKRRLAGEGRRPPDGRAVSEETNSTLGGQGGGTGQPQQHGNKSTSPTSSSFYVVHTAAWNCTCAAFAFAAFPPPPAPVPEPEPEPETTTADAAVSSCGLFLLGMSAEEENETVDEKSRFGGLGLFTTDHDDGGGGDDDDDEDDSESGGKGKGGGTPPCCKHLLACVLAERWAAVLGRYVTQRTVAREEMAGIFADL